jgi:glutamate N-acetyltransferase/amino-acid N-acetyltransferase
MPGARHITLPKGFVAAGVTCGIKPSGSPDLAVIASESLASCALVTTRNQIVGAPILWCRKILPKGKGKIRGIVINSGCSNVCTGKKGLADAEAMAKRTARHLGCEPGHVLVASTGVIGEKLPMDKIRPGIDEACGRLSRRDDGLVVRAIMTTDTREKTAVIRRKIAGKEITLAGIVKGSGMIAPCMATMIAAITTDAAISPAALSGALARAVDDSFHAITVDSDTSTSDTVAALASGAAGNRSITSSSREMKPFAAMMYELCRALAWSVVADGEGATKVARVEVRGAASRADAKIAAKSVADSPLFKTAIHGADPNWGRIAMALGKSSAKVRAETLKIRIGGKTIFSRGTGRSFDHEAVEAHLSGREIHVLCDLGQGDGAFTAWTCDLSREYIAINADYTT